MKKFIIISAVLFLAVAGPALAQTPNTAEKQAVTRPKPVAFSITGNFTKLFKTYIIRQQKPPERFAIMNPNPEILDSLVKSGKTVTIEAISVMGDNVNIQKIDGEPYEAAKAAKDEVK